MDERSSADVPGRGTAGRAEIVGYGVLATAVAAGVLYLDDQRPRDIAIIVAAILALLVTLVLIAPRLGEPEKHDVGEHAAHTPGPNHTRVPEPGFQPPTAPRPPFESPPSGLPPSTPTGPPAPSPTASPAGPPAPSPTGLPAPHAPAGPDASSPEAGADDPAGSPKRTRRAKRGRRRR